MKVFFGCFFAALSISLVLSSLHVSEGVYETTSERNTKLRRENCKRLRCQAMFNSFNPTARLEQTTSFARFSPSPRMVWMRKFEQNVVAIHTTRSFLQSCPRICCQLRLADDVFKFIPGHVVKFSRRRTSKNPKLRRWGFPDDGTRPCPKSANGNLVMRQRIIFPSCKHWPYNPFCRLCHSAY
jgi:hypothetical protein